MPTLLEAALRRDRWIVGTALAVLAALAWAYLVATGTGGGAMIPGGASQAGAGMAGMDMAGMDMTGMDMPGMSMAAMPGTASPGTASPAAVLRAAAFLVVMWLVMMVAMMTPSAAPMILIYAAVARRAVARREPFASTAWFVLGYFLVWAAFSIVAAGLQAGLTAASVLSPAMAIGDRRIGAALLLLAALYQLSSLKQACLGQCQAPLAFIAGRGGFPAGRAGAVAMGLRHGAYCVGCCWALMALLFVFGVMAMAWVAALTVLVAVEKMASSPAVAYVAAALLTAAAVGLLAA